MTGKSNDLIFFFLQARGTIIFIKNNGDAQMKVVMINGQNHKGSTWHIGRMLAEKLTVPEDITEFFLPRDMPHFCLGCTQCFMKSETLCPHAAQLAPLADDKALVDRLCELNVIEQVLNVCQTTVVQEAWNRGQELTIHGWIFGLDDGLVRDLGISIDAAAAVQATYEQALAALGSA